CWPCHRAVPVQACSPRRRPLYATRRVPACDILSQAPLLSVFNLSAVETWFKTIDSIAEQLLLRRGELGRVEHAARVKVRQLFQLLGDVRRRRVRSRLWMRL